MNVADGKSGHTPLHLAAESGRLDIVELLLAKRADVQLASYYGCTPMQAASARAHNKIVKLLVEHGAESVSENRVFNYCYYILPPLGNSCQGFRKTKSNNKSSNR